MEAGNAEAKANYEALIAKVESSKKDMTTDGGYDEIVIEDFYEVFLENLKKLEKLPEEFKAAAVEISYKDYVAQHLMKVLCNHEEANYIIMYMRFLAATYLKANAILYEDFLGEPMSSYCQREVE